MQRGEAGVSPVVGTLLILTVFVVSMAAVLFWGIPQYQSAREQTLFESTRIDMEIAADDLRSLSLVGAAKTIKRPVVTLPAGELQMGPGSRMLVSFGIQASDHASLKGTAVEVATIADFSYQDWDSASAEITLVNEGPAIPAPILVNISVSDLRSTGGSLLGYLETTGWPAGASKTVPLSEAKAGRTLQVDVYSPTVDPEGLRARALIFNATRLRFTWAGEQGSYEVLSELGGIFYRTDEHFRLSKHPLLSVPTSAVDEDGVPVQDSFHVRVPLVPGSGGFAGRGSVALTMRLAVTHQLLEEQSSAAMRIYVSGDRADVWGNYLVDRGFSQEADGSLLFQLTSGTSYLPFRAVLIIAEIDVSMGSP